MTITTRFRIPLIVLLFLALSLAGCSSGNEREPVHKAVSAAQRSTSSWTFPIFSSAADGPSIESAARRGLRERFRRGLAISGRYDGRFHEIFYSWGLPEDLVYLPHVKSSPQTNARSSVGTAGVWQFVRGTGKRYMTGNGTVEDAASYLGTVCRKLSSWPPTVTCLQSWPRPPSAETTSAIVRKYKGPYFQFAFRNFYAEFIAAREVAGYLHRYFPEGIRHQRPLSRDRLVLRHGIPHPESRRVHAPASGSEPALEEIGPATMVAKAEPKREPIETAKVEPKQKPIKKAHVVKPNETLYRAST